MIIYAHVSGKAGETLTATASHAQQQGIAQGLADDAGDATQVPDGVHEEHQPHLCCVDLVVVIQVVLYHLHHLKKPHQTALTTDSDVSFEIRNSVLQQ